MDDIFAANQRILLLQGTEKNQTLSNEMGQRLLRLYGHSLSLEKVNSIMTFLAERQLVKVEKLSGELWVMRLTRRGKDVATGQARETGIDAPVEE